jgi:hypothetical protein
MRQEGRPPVPKVLTSAANIVCAHQGKVTVVPTQQAFLVDNKPVLVMGDLEGKPIAGCTTPATPSTVPCTATATMIIGAATKLTAGGKPVLLDTAKGLTNGVPPGQWQVQSAGQTKLEAS